MRISIKKRVVMFFYLNVFRLNLLWKYDPLRCFAVPRSASHLMLSSPSLCINSFPNISSCWKRTFWFDSSVRNDDWNVHYNWSPPPTSFSVLIWRFVCRSIILTKLFVSVILKILRLFILNCPKSQGLYCQIAVTFTIHLGMWTRTDPIRISR